MQIPGSARLRKVSSKVGFALGAGGLMLVATLALNAGGAQVAIAQTSSTGSSTSQALQQLLPPGVTPQQVLQQLESGAPSGTTVPSPQPAQQVLSPSLQGAAPAQSPLQSAAMATPKTPSQLETLYSQRIGAPISQFGYDLVANGGTVYATLNGAVQDSYILGPGDQIIVTLQGQQNASYTIAVDRNGQIVVPNVQPVAASGRRFGDFRADLLAALKRAYIQTNAYVSIGQIRQISVRVVGDVTNPGVYAATGLSTVLDALNLAGGIQKSGSLRNVVLVRNGKAHHIDLYAMLLPHGSTPDLVLAQGDRVVVPPIGATMAVTGDVARPAIYELPPGQKSISQAQALSLGGGPRMRGVYREMVRRILPNGKEADVDISGEPNARIQDSEILFVNRAVNYTEGEITLAGDVRVPGQFALNRFPTLRDLLPSADVLAPNPYMLMGVIERTDPHSLQRTLLPFSPLHVLQGRENAKLINYDVVYIMTLPEMQALVVAGGIVPNVATSQGGAGLGAASAPGVAQGTAATITPGLSSIMTGSVPVAPGATPSSSTISTVVPGQSTALGAAGISATGAAPSLGLPGTTTGIIGTAAPGATVAAPATAATAANPLSIAASDTGSAILALGASNVAFFGHKLVEYRTTLNGAVHLPGTYLAAPGTTMTEVIAAAGGLDADVDLSAFEVTSISIDNRTGVSVTTRKTYSATPAQLSTLVIQPYDTVTFHDVFGNNDKGSVVVAGEVRYPGTYNILRGERLSSLLARAGGLTDVAYPYGAVFTRGAVADQEHQAFVYQANELEDQLAAYLSTSQITPDAVSYMQGLAQRLRTTQTTGRVAIVADPAQLSVNPQMDIILEPGDQLTMPRRPASVAIMGEVLNPTAVLYRPNLSVSDYINLAGGASVTADESMTFIVAPDGSAYPAGESMWSFDAGKIAPGATVVVPRDIVGPIDWLTLADDIAKIVSELAVTGASFSVITRPGG